MITLLAFCVIMLLLFAVSTEALARMRAGAVAQGASY
jgi:hypothetical protein